MRFPVDVRWSDEDKIWIADVYDLPGCLAHGDTQAAAVQAAAEAADLWVEVAREEKRAIPAPSSEQEASGQFVLRLPKSLHARLRRGADREGVSLNQHVLTLLAAAGSVSEHDAQITTRLAEQTAEILKNLITRNVERDEKDFIYLRGLSTHVPASLHAAEPSVSYQASMMKLKKGSTKPKAKAKR